MSIFHLISGLFSSWTSIFLVAAVPLIVKWRRILYIAAITFPRDIKLIRRAVRYYLRLKLYAWRNMNAGKCLERSVQRSPNKACFVAGDDRLTFQEVDDLANKLGNFFTTKGFKKGDVVALFMGNRVEYPAIWLGLSKIGVITALINYNLRLQSLRHCVQVANAKALIYGGDLADAVKEAVDSGEFSDIDIYSFDSEGTSTVKKAKDLQKELKQSSTKRPKPSAPVNFTDKLCYVYTSGTTGLPKAAVIKHHRFIFAAVGCHDINGCRDDDIFLTPLPLYHMAGGMFAVGQAVIHTTTVVITKKFSASKFWHDCIRHKVTVTQYLGEICRFLLSQPERPEDKQHNIRLVMGNGLRAEIWNEFVTRFNIPELVEFYGSTEGNSNLSNVSGHLGAVGFLPRILLPLLPMGLVKVDQYTGEPIRDPKTGLAIRCQPDEAGELMAVIKLNNPIRDFPGYTDSKSSNTKILHNIFTKGDSVFRAGDILVMDELGYFYFRDRIGDTFRWKGENVSTMEVESIVGNFCDLKDVAVYGVQIPGMDGRAGMAAIADPEGTVDWTKLTEGIVKSLPSYARPVFIRVLVQNVELTGTFKLRKVDLQKEGIDLSLIGKDKLYIFSGGKYLPLTQDIHAKVISGQMRL